MRVLLFRGKRTDGQWIYGSLLKVTYDGNTYNLIFADNFLFVFGEATAMEHAAVDPSTVGQFAGLTDKNGKKVFEGDIGRFKQTDGAKRDGKPITCIGKVVYNAKTASFAVESRDEAGCEYYDYFPIKGFEVIGNIHDHPELLEVTDDA